MSGGVGLAVGMGSIEREIAASEMRKKALTVGSKAVSYESNPNGSRKERRVYASMMRKKRK